MDKQTALNIIKRKASLEFRTRTATADALGINRVNLQLALDGKLARIPDYLLDYAGLAIVETEPTYKKKAVKND